MYCVKVEPGKERIKVRQVASGFLPSYLEADETGRPDERKRFVVPGYVFMLQYAPGAVPVPEMEDDRGDFRPRAFNAGLCEQEDCGRAIAGGGGQHYRL